MTDIVFEELTEKELDFLSNGCGPKGAGIVPDFASTNSCDRHDVDYWIGGGEQDRKDSDWRLYQNMVQDSYEIEGFFGRIYRQVIARTYYCAVRWLAAGSFHYGEKRTLEDLRAAMEAEKNA